MTLWQLNHMAPLRNLGESTWSSWISLCLVLWASLEYLLSLNSDRPQSLSNLKQSPSVLPAISAEMYSAIFCW